VTKTNLAGDGQADLTVHGGEDKAVYAYSLDHYAYWQLALKSEALPFGQFGENLTIRGLDETESCIGDHWEVGTAIFAITQPRQPCYKLGVRFRDREMPKRFAQSGRTGVYLKVLREGTLASGDEVVVLRRGIGGVTVQELFRAYMNPSQAESKEVLRKALEVADLSNAWRQTIAARVQQ
jgi:MOSC domain-containing protein YiiM